jgi:hypothetical protein
MNSSIGRMVATTVVVFTLAAWVPPSPVSAAEGSLVKLACPAGADAAHPCRAVYYHGYDGKRHAFPHEKVYFTWYASFSNITNLSSSSLAAIPLGQNVTYRPGVKMVKFMTDAKVYAVEVGGVLRPIATETVAIDLYGPNWNQQIDDISDAFFANYRFGDPINSSADFHPADESSYANTIDDDLPATHRSISVSTAEGSFSVEFVKLQASRFRMETAVAEESECSNNCAAKSLSEYVSDSGAFAGMHGSYFCPPDYPDCADKINTFLSPFFDTERDRMANESGLRVHKGPILTYDSEARYRYFHRTEDMGSSVNDFEDRYGVELIGAASNYPSLVENGNVIVQSEERLEAGMLQNGVRGGIGVSPRHVYLVIARNTTVPNLAEIMKELGATDALNLDGGGSAAMWYDGSYRFGPGRLLPNAILFVAKN